MALVFDGDAQTVTGYLNGESFGSLATGFTSIPGHSGGIGIGIINDDTRFSNSEVAASGLYLDGNIDEVALYNQVLSSTQIQRHARGCTFTGPAVGVAISQTVPANTTFNLPGSGIGWSCTGGNPAGTACIFSPGSLDAGANGSANFAVTVEDPLSAGVIQIATAAAITDDGISGPDQNPDDNRGSDTTEIEGTTGGTRIFLPLILAN